jgi:hypothetical protein
LQRYQNHVVAAEAAQATYQGLHPSVPAGGVSLIQVRVLNLQKVINKNV